jgi:hypothetical protein
MRDLPAWMQRFLIWCRLRRPPLSLPANEDAALLLPMKVPARALVKREAAGPGLPGGGDFYFRDDLLDQLGHYMRSISYLRKHDSESYDLYRQVGGALLSNHAEAHITEIEPHFLKIMPSFGAVFLGGRPKDFAADKMAATMMYFTKYKTPPHNVQRINRGVMYRVSVFFCDETTADRGVIAEIPVSVADDGTITVLRSLISHHQTIRRKVNDRHHHRGETFTISQERWGIHPMLLEWANDHKRPVVVHLSSMFSLAANFWASTQMSMVRVEAARGAEIAVFGVDVIRTPYFFADREKVEGKRIFHIVRTHQRVRADGHISAVRTHFRGLRKFKWNGYAIKITVPGWHHRATTELDIGAEDSDFESAPGYMNMAQVGHYLAEHTQH